ncbi:HSPB1-associated protein 1 homolog isoform X2 [Anneissia japonica]|nr:HSPB1-associated protein 1 homolog isoform X2 [Anneissia japonica]
MATLKDLMEWCTAGASATTETPTNRISEERNPLMKYDSEVYWCYADYKYMLELFSEHPELLKEVRWSDLGFEGHDGTQSTIWIGSEGANTPCHYDTYGCNLVLQVVGKKNWQLFPPHQTECLYPTRIPFEESSVFSDVNIVYPDFGKCPLFKAATPYNVTLQPGDILFVPHHWWHYVESLETSISINCWMDLAIDDECRLEEAITRTVFCQFFDSRDSNDKGDGTDGIGWLNPTESITSTNVNMEYINKALKVVKHTSFGKTSSDCRCAGTPDDLSSKNRTSDNPAESQAEVTGKRKMVDDNLRVKKNKPNNTKDELCMDFFKRIGLEIEILPCQEKMSKDVKEMSLDIDSRNQDEDVNMRTLLQCLTHPRIVSEIANLLKDKV